MEQTNDYNVDTLKLRALKEAGISYSLAAALPALLSIVLALIILAAGLVGYENADWYKYLAYLIPQICFAAAAIVYFRRSKVPVKKTYCGCKWYYFVIALALQFGLLFSLSELNNYFIEFLKLFGYHEAKSTVPSLDGWNLLPAILVIAVLPAIFEETIFRGILSRQMHESGWGLLATVLISGALFSLFHHNPEQTLYQFVCGACLTLVALRSGSVLPTIVAHFVNNASILVFESTGYGSAWNFSFGGYLALVLVSAATLIGTLVYLVFFDKNAAQKGGVKYGKLFFLAAAVGIAFSGVQWVMQLIVGFV